MDALVRIDLGEIPGCRDWLVSRWREMHPATPVLGVNELGLWHDDEVGSTHLSPWPEVLVAVLEGIVREESALVR